MRARPFALLLPVLGAACGIADSPFAGGAGGKADSSPYATVLDFEFDGVLVTDDFWPGREDATIQNQLLYTIGELNGHRGVGRLDRLELTDVVTTELADEASEEGPLTEIRYHARMPVAWGSKTDLPAELTFRLPRDVSYDGLVRFTETYMHDCVDRGAHDVDSGSMWYYYRPDRSGCELASEDVVVAQATVTISPVNSSGTYPEYDKLWDDDLLKVVAIFGKYEDGTTTSADVGIRAYNSFLNATKLRLGKYTLETTPAEVPSSPGVDVPDVQFRATLPDGRRLEVTALLVDNVRTAGPEFDARYAELSTEADLIAYNGHAGLGSNVRALARKGHFRADKYLTVFMNGCDTFAYVDGYLAETRAKLNPDDPSGTKYMDIVTNAMPAFFGSMADAALAMVDGLAQLEEPRTYDQILENIDESQVVLVTGDEDNVFRP